MVKTKKSGTCQKWRCRIFFNYKPFAKKPPLSKETPLLGEMSSQMTEGSAVCGEQGGPSKMVEGFNKVESLKLKVESYFGVRTWLP
ncbi:MAG: hypothetical protein IKL57_06125 [Oscillospiraceae bacterium]|nr:hypothetical protein [Oscillospiraceae bacterium]